MGIINNFRNKTGLYFLRHHSASAQHRADLTDFTKVNSLVLLFEIKDSQIPLTITQFVQQLRDEKKMVYKVIYYTGKPKQLTLTSDENQIVFTRLEVNFFGVPYPKIVKDFSAIEANYLIDLNLYESFPLIYLASASKTQLRIGLHSQLRLPHFDILFNQQVESRQEFTEHLLHYLRILKPPKK